MVGSFRDFFRLSGGARNEHPTWAEPGCLPPSRPDAHGLPGSSPGQALIGVRKETGARIGLYPVFFSSSSPRAIDPGSISNG